MPRAPFAKLCRPTGPEDASLMLVGEAPNRDEDRQGYSAVGMTGQTLDSYLFRLGITRDQVYVTNLVKYYPGEGEEADIEDVIRDWPVFVSEIQKVRPHHIIALGALATEHLVSGTDAALYDLNALNGHTLRGRVRDAQWVGWVTPVFGPGAGLHDAHMAGLTFQGLKRALLPFDSPPSFFEVYQVAGEHDIADAFMGTEYHALPVDTESPGGVVACLTFSPRPGVGYLIEASNRKHLALFEHWRQHSRLPLLLHNSLHDLRWLRELGIDLKLGEYEDSIVKAFVTAQFTPQGQGLKNLSFNLCGMVQDDYQDITREADERIAREYLEKARERFVSGEIEIEVKGRAHPPAKRLSSLLKPGKESTRKRWIGFCEGDKKDERIGKDVRDAVESLQGPMRSVVWEDVPLEAWLPYACADADATGRIDMHLSSHMDRLSLHRPYQIDMGVIPVLERMRDVGMRVDTRKLATLQDEMETEHRRLHASLIAMAAKLGVKDYNPNSGPQTAELLYVRMKLPASRLTKSRDRESTDKKALSAISCHKNPKDPHCAACRSHHELGHEFVACLSEYKEIEKILTAYVIPLWDFIGLDNRVHPNWRHTVVVSGRLATNSPNLLAFPTRSKWGKRLRACLIAGPGKVYLACDQSQIELRVLASESKDEAMMQIFWDDDDLHTITAMMVFGVSREDAEADKDYCRTLAKIINFGIAYGLSAGGLMAHLATMGVMKSEQECEQIIESWFAARPGVRSYLVSAVSETRRFGYVRDMWGRIRWLPLVWSPIARFRAEAERQAGNFKIQSGAQSAMKIGMRYYWEKIRPRIEGMGIECEPIIQVHDDLMFEVDEDAVDTVKPWIEEAVTQAAQEEFAVPITCGTKVGKSWGELSKVTVADLIEEVA